MGIGGRGTGRGGSCLDRGGVRARCHHALPGPRLHESARPHPINPCMYLSLRTWAMTLSPNSLASYFQYSLFSALWPASNFLCSRPHFLFIIIAPPKLLIIMFPPTQPSKLSLASDCSLCLTCFINSYIHKKFFFSAIFNPGLQSSSD